MIISSSFGVGCDQKWCYLSGWAVYYEISPSISTILMYSGQCKHDRWTLSHWQGNQSVAGAVCSHDFCLHLTIHPSHPHHTLWSHWELQYLVCFSSVCNQLFSHPDVVKGHCCPCLIGPNALNGLCRETVMTESICMAGLFTGSCARFSRTLSEEYTEGSFYWP